MHFQGQDTIAFGGRGVKSNPTVALTLRKGCALEGGIQLNGAVDFFGEGGCEIQPNGVVEFFKLQLSIEVSNPTAPLTWG